jgi:hypothetical protein
LSHDAAKQLTIAKGIMGEKIRRITHGAKRLSQPGNFS